MKPCSGASAQESKSCFRQLFLIHKPSVRRVRMQIAVSPSGFSALQWRHYPCAQVEHSAHHLEFAVLDPWCEDGLKILEPLDTEFEFFRMAFSSASPGAPSL
jgi:hypothetical protein